MKPWLRSREAIRRRKQHLLLLGEARLFRDHDLLDRQPVRRQVRGPGFSLRSAGQQKTPDALVYRGQARSNDRKLLQVLEQSAAEFRLSGKHLRPKPKR